jgi:hypothetical protein
MSSKTKSKREGVFAGTVGSHKKVKKIKQKQKQKQQQTVIINIGKDKLKRGGKYSRRIQSRKPSEGRDSIQPAVNPPFVAYQSYQQVPLQFDRPKETPITEAPTLKEVAESKPFELPVREEKAKTATFVPLDDIENPKVIYPEEVDWAPTQQQRQGVKSPSQPAKSEPAISEFIPENVIVENQTKENPPVRDDNSTITTIPTPKRRGRPKGSKNKPKVYAYPLFDYKNPLPSHFFESTNNQSSRNNINQPISEFYTPSPELFHTDNPMTISDLNTKDKRNNDKRNNDKNEDTFEDFNQIQDSNIMGLSSHPRLGRTKVFKEVNRNSLYFPIAEYPQKPTFYEARASSN